MIINNVGIYSTYNKGKSAVTERFIKTLKNKIFKHMTAVSENVSFDVLEDLLINTIIQFIEALKSNRLMLHQILMLNTVKILMKKILNSKLVIVL